MLDVYSTLLAIAAVINLGLTAFIYIENRYSRINQSFALFTFFLCLWSLAILGFRLADSANSALLSLRLSYIAATFIAACYQYFSIAFPENNQLSRLGFRLLLATSFALSLALLIPGFLIAAIGQDGAGWFARLVPTHYFVFAAVFCFLFVGGQVRLWRKFFGAKELVRRQLAAICLSVSTVGLIGITSNLILPSPFFENFHFVWMGPVFTSVFAVVITYSVFRYNLFSTKALIAEILVFALWLFVFIRLLLATAQNERIANGLLLAVSIPIGLRLLRSVKLEVTARENLALANARLKELDQAKSEFLSIAAHQLRSPITVIRGYAENLRDGEYGPLTQTALEPISRIAERAGSLAGVIDDYLNVTRIELGKMQYDFQVADLKEIVTRIVEEMRPTATKRGLYLSLSTEGDVRFQAKLDVNKITQVVSNLLDNAIKYTPSGAIAVKLVHQGTGSLLLTIQDSGVGIDAATLPKLFQKFSRAENANRTNNIGTGLGLYVAAQLVAAHKGRLWAESPGSGKGATFLIELPALAAN